MPILEARAELTNEEVAIVENILNDEFFPWYYMHSMTIDDVENEGDGYFFFTHTLYPRSSSSTVQPQASSNATPFFENIFRRFCKNFDVPVNIIYRASLNFALPQNVTASIIHRDHDWDHKVFLLYLSHYPKSGTRIYDFDEKTVLKDTNGSFLNGVLFDGNPHSVTFPTEQNYKRLACIFTFN